MDPLAENPKQKTALTLALELGVRTDTVVQTLQQLGLDAEDASAVIDPDMEAVVIEQMVSNGAVPARLASGKGRRTLSEDPLVDDKLLSEALGAGETGYSESRIPRQLIMETDFAEKPSFFQRWFGKKKVLARSLKTLEVTEGELQSFFAAPTQRPITTELSPFQEIERRESSAPPPPGETAAEEEIVEETGPEEIELDENIDVDIEGAEPETGEGEFEDLNEEELKTLAEISEEVLAESGIEGEEVEGVEGVEAAAEEGGEEEVPLEDLETLTKEAEGETGAEKAPEGEAKEGEEEQKEGEEIPEVVTPEVHIPGFFERLISRIQLTQTEMWTLMGLSVITMLILLGITVYWWMNISPKAQIGLLEKADQYYLAAGQVGKEFPEVVDNLQNAANTYETFMKKYPSNPGVDEVFSHLCDCYYRIAEGYEKAGKSKESEEPYRKMAEYYQQYLTFLYDQANRLVGKDPKASYLTFPDVKLQREALFRIAQAQRKLKQFDEALKRLNDFVRQYKDSEYTMDALLDIGETYQEWSKVNQNEELPLLNEAANAYQKALEKMPADAHDKRMQLYTRLAEIKERLYERTQTEEKNSGTDTHLSEAIGFYEKAEAEAQQAKALPFRDKVQVYKHLGDLYLLRGRESGISWHEYEKGAELYPDGIAYKDELLKGAEREKATTIDLLGKSSKNYDELLKNRNRLSAESLHEILLDKADSHYILREYPKAIAAGKEILSGTVPIDKTIKTKLLYLMGNAAWEDAKNTNDYTPVKQLYREALELDPFYPKDQNGETSHLAEIRLTNAYFLLDKKYEDAIKRFANAVVNYPETRWTYQTLYWYAKALEEYGDELTTQAGKKESDARKQNGSSILMEEARSLRQKAKTQYQDARDYYGRAIASRDKSQHVDSKDQRYLIEIMFNRGSAAYKAGLLTGVNGAEKFLEEALERFQDREVAQKYIPHAIETLGDLNMILGSYDKAIKYYLEYRKNAYEDANARLTMKLADAYLNQLSYDKAREWYRTIIQEYPPPTSRNFERDARGGRATPQGPGFEALKKIAESYYREASGPERRNKLLQALQSYKELAERYPKDPKNPTISADPDSQRMVGNICYELEQYPEAIANYQAFLNHFPNYPRRGIIYYKIGNACMALKDYDQAINALTNVTQDSVDNLLQYADSQITLGQALYAKAETYRQAGDTSLFEHYLEKAKRAFNSVSISQDAKKIKEADLARGAIDALIASRKELEK